MSTFAPIYNALRKASVPEAEALAVADSLADAFAERQEVAEMKADVSAIDKRLHRMAVDIAVLKWGVAATFAAVMSLVLKSFAGF